jgi:hypothetical protein
MNAWKKTGMGYLSFCLFITTRKGAEGLNRFFGCRIGVINKILGGRCNRRYNLIVCCVKGAKTVFKLEEKLRN